MSQALIGKNISTTVLGGILTIDNTNSRVGINEASPEYPLDVTGDISTTTLYRVGSASVLTATTLGSAVVNSSLTGVGTLTDLTVSGNLLCTSSNIEEMFRVPAHAVPTSNAHSLGDMFIDTGDSNKLKICTTAGTPGTFTVVGTQS